MNAADLHQSILDVARTDAATLRSDLTIRQALDEVREHGIGEKIIYFYVLDVDGILRGVLPTRRLLTAALDQRVSDVMIPRVITLPAHATVLDACEAFVMNKFLALPVVDDHNRIVGVVDVGLLSEEAFDLAEREQMDAIFETIGFNVSQVRDASVLRGFRFRFPWLLATIASGTICAVLVGAFEATLAQSLVLAFFMTLVLGLGESVSIQSMTVTIQALRSVKPSIRWYMRALRRELGTALILGLVCGVTVGGIVLVWRGDIPAAAGIGSSVLIALTAACFFGLTIPTVLHAMRLDPKIAAGPLTLALADVCTIVAYFAVASMIL
ncbi:MAG: magnesium transporter [Ignavibacteriae bacterium]|nr:magnesium transporter [Ignavibacteriota bacterium]